MTTRLFDDLTDDEIEAMSPEELAKFGASEFGGGTVVDQDEEGEPAPAADPAPGADPAPEADPAAAAGAPAPGPDYEAMARELAQLRQEREATMAQLRDPAAVRAYLASLDPSFGQPAAAPAPAAEPVAPTLDDDPMAAIQYMIQQATAPLLQQIDAMSQREAQRQREDGERQMMMSMVGKYGQDFTKTLQRFDAEHPHLRETHPELRYHAARSFYGLAAPAVDPAADEARIKAAAEAMLAERLKGGGRMPMGVPTLGGAPQGRGDQGPADLDRLGMSDYAGMSLDQMKALGRQAFGIG